MRVFATVAMHCVQTCGCSASGTLLGPQSHPCFAQGSLIEFRILSVVWPHTSSGTVMEVGGSCLVGTEDSHSEGEGQNRSLNSTPKPPNAAPQFPYLPNIGNDSFSPPRVLSAPMCNLGFGDSQRTLTSVYLAP